MSKFRQKAEEILRNQQSENSINFSLNDIESLIHELQIRQIELEIQNNELQQANEQFSILNKKYVALYDFTPLGYCTLNQTGQILEANLSFAKKLGVERNRLINTSFHIYIFQEDRDLFFLHFKQLCQVKVEKNFKIRFLRKNKNNFYAQIESKIVHYSDTSMIYLSITDITKHKQAEQILKEAKFERKQAEQALNEIKIEREQVEQALNEAKKEVESANRAKSEFLASINREIQTTTKVIDNVQLSHKSSDILDLSKMEAGCLEIQYNCANLRTLFSEIQQFFMMKVDKKGLNFILDINKDFPTGLIIDEMRLRQVLVNFINNALKFTEQGYIKLSALNVFSKNQRSIDLIITVEDTGIGIPKKQQAQIFESFREIEGQNPQQYDDDTDLGLVVSKQLINLMNGEISLSSNDDKGSVFAIILKDVELSAIEVGKVQKQAFDLKNIIFENATVLIVDDVEANRILTREYLNHVNLNVIEAQNGEAGLLSAEENQPDLILMDLKMPVMDGYQATEKLKKNETTKNIPIVALTAFSTSKEKEKIEAADFDSYLYKPVDVSELLEKLSHYLKHTKREVKKEEKSESEKSEQIKIPLSAEELADLLNILEKEMLPQSQELASTLEMDGVETFAKRAIDLGETYHIELLIDYGKNLTELADNLELQSMVEILIIFQEIVLKINKMKENNHFKLH